MLHTNHIHIKKIEVEKIKLNLLKVNQLFIIKCHSHKTGLKPVFLKESKWMRV